MPGILIHKVFDAGITFSPFLRDPGLSDYVWHQLVERTMKNKGGNVKRKSLIRRSVQPGHEFTHSTRPELALFFGQNGRKLVMLKPIQFVQRNGRHGRVDTETR